MARSVLIALAVALWMPRAMADELGYVVLGGDADVYPSSPTIVSAGASAHVYADVTPSFSVGLAGYVSFYGTDLPATIAPGFASTAASIGTHFYRGLLEAQWSSDHEHTGVFFWVRGSLGAVIDSTSALSVSAMSWGPTVRAAAGVDLLLLRPVWLELGAHGAALLLFDTAGVGLHSFYAGPGGELSVRVDVMK